MVHRIDDMQGAENGQKTPLVVHVCLNVSISVFIIVRATKFGIRKVYLLQQEFISPLPTLRKSEICAYKA